MSRKSGNRFSDEDMRQSKNLQPFPVEWLGRTGGVAASRNVKYATLAPSHGQIIAAGGNNQR
jgi:hypothetical protein